MYLLNYTRFLNICHLSKILTIFVYLTRDVENCSFITLTGYNACVKIWEITLVTKLEKEILIYEVIRMCILYTIYTIIFLILLYFKMIHNNE